MTALPALQHMGAFELARPWALALLPLAAWLLWQGLRRQDAMADAAPAATLVHPDLHGLLDQARPGGRIDPRRILAACALASWIVALAQPQLPGAWVRPPAQGRDVIVILDSTLSMTLQDLRWGDKPAERLAVVKQVFADFVRGSPGDRFGVIAYGARAATLLPPTFDRDLAIAMLARVHADMLGDGGCLGDAMALALRQVAARGGLAPVLVIYSDNGWSQQGQISPAAATALARSLGVRVFTVQVGDHPADGTPYTVPAFHQPQPDLATIARETGGAWFYAADAGAQRRAIAAIAAQAPTLQPPPRQRSALQLYPWFVGLGLALLVASQLLRPGRGGART